jgi:O-antigen biosynthesis protein
MKKFLAISEFPPMPDMASGDLRFFSILKMLGKFGEVTLVIKDLRAWIVKNTECSRYKAMFTEAGIILYEGDIFSALNSNKFDFLFLEFYDTAIEFGDMARYLQPQALLVVDSVDVQFNRLQAKATLTGNIHDQNEADEIRVKELNAYRKADVTIAVSEDDKTLLLKALPDKFITVLPNVHTIYESPPQKTREFGRLIFIGGFSHSPNVDAVLYFLNEVMPLIRARTSDVKLSIIGSHVPLEILDMEAPDVEIIGYVPDTAPYLQSAYISIAPLRYGGGMKGKVGEAMSHGLPVVTTCFGAEGFGLTPGVHLLVVDTPETFADAIVRLLNDSNYHNELGQAGYRFVIEQYSPQAMQTQLARFLEQMKDIVPIRQPWHKLFLYRVKSLFERYIGWRLRFL